MQERRDVRARAAEMQEQSRFATLGVDRPTTRTRERDWGECSERVGLAAM
jgi:hypothetical protein